MKPLKVLEGPPHDLGQYYLLMDPGVSGEFLSVCNRLLEPSHLIKGHGCRGKAGANRIQWSWKILSGS